MKRAEVLDDAKQKVTVDRAADHGDMEDNFKTISAYWSEHLDHKVTPIDVGIMMTLLENGKSEGQSVSSGQLR
jgi:hypothetical protein